MPPQTKYGFIPDVIDPERDHVFGGLFSAPKIELRPDGQWDNYLPEFEAQNVRGIETMACVSFGTLNTVEILLRRMYGREENYSERYTSILAETTKSGNSPKKVADTIRHKGLIAQHYLPFDETIKSWEDFHSPKPMPERYTEIGQKFLDAHEFTYEWLYGMGEEINQEKMMDALRFGPLGAAVQAWPTPLNGIYFKAGQSNHWITIFGYQRKRFWKIFDHYDQAIKFLDWKYEFDFVERFFIKDLQRPKEPAEPGSPAVGPKENWFVSFVSAVMGFIKRIFGIS